MGQEKSAINLGYALQLPFSQLPPPFLPLTPVRFLLSPRPDVRLARRSHHESRTPSVALSPL